MHIETKIIKLEICTFTSRYIKNMWQGCEVKTVHKIKKAQKQVKNYFFSIKLFSK